jgi:hypothetical protein
MTSTDRRNDLGMPALQKLEWVTPRISLMESEDTEGFKAYARVEGFPPPNNLVLGPS